MVLTKYPKHIRGTIRAAILGCALIVSACASQSPTASTSGIYDPDEANNRQMHAVNRGLDKALLGPASKGYGGVIPDEIRTSIDHFSHNLGTPSDIVNSVLQGDFGNAGHNTLRFLVNSTLGFAGLFDVASDLGVQGQATDFGETLHVWGAQEGAYNELPALGPSTDRDSAGFVVDMLINPLNFIAYDPASYIGLAAYFVDRLNYRYKYQTTVDSILYESADSYAQARLLYIQNRRFQLGIDNADADAGLDPYEDPYADF